MRSDLRKVPVQVWIIGGASMLITASAAMFFSVFGLFLDSIGLSLKTIGHIGGLTEGFGYLCKIASGVMSDFLCRRKLIFALGAVMTTLSKPISALFMTKAAVVAGRVLDRVGNGLQATPRDALVGEYAPKTLEGLCFGIRQALGTLGSVFGVLIVWGLLARFTNGYQVVFSVSSVLGAVAFLIIVFFVKDRSREETEPTTEEILSERLTKPGALDSSYKQLNAGAPEGGLEELRLKARPARKRSSAFHLKDVFLLPRNYWKLMVIVGVFMLGRMSESLITLFGKKTFGLSDAGSIRIILFYNMTSAAAAYLTGRLAQNIKPKNLMLSGSLVMLGANVAMRLAGEIGAYGLFMTGVILWGIQIGLMQNVFCAEVTAMVEAKLKGTAFGIFYFITALGVYFANQVSGLLMDHGSGAFLYSAIVGLVSCGMICVLRKRK